MLCPRNEVHDTRAAKMRCNVIEIPSRIMLQYSSPSKIGHCAHYTRFLKRINGLRYSQGEVVHERRQHAANETSPTSTTTDHRHTPRRKQSIAAMAQQGMSCDIKLSFQCVADFQKHGCKVSKKHRQRWLRPCDSVFALKHHDEKFLMLKIYCMPKCRAISGARTTQKWCEYIFARFSGGLSSDANFSSSKNPSERTRKIYNFSVSYRRVLRLI